MDKKALVEHFTRLNEALQIDRVGEMFADDLIVYANVFPEPKDKAGEIEFSRSLQEQCRSVKMEILSLEERDGGVLRTMRATGERTDGQAFSAYSEVLFLFNERGQIREMRETIEMGELAADARI